MLARLVSPQQTQQHYWDIHIMLWMTLYRCSSQCIYNVKVLNKLLFSKHFHKCYLKCQYDVYPMFHLMFIVTFMWHFLICELTTYQCYEQCSWDIKVLNTFLLWQHLNKCWDLMLNWGLSNIIMLMLVRCYINI